MRYDGLKGKFSLEFGYAKTPKLKLNEQIYDSSQTEADPSAYLTDPAKVWCMTDEIIDMVDSTKVIFFISLLSLITVTNSDTSQWDIISFSFLRLPYASQVK